MPAPDLTPLYALEVVQYRLVDGTDVDAFLGLNREVGEEFYRPQPGYIHREIGRSDEGIWLISCTWETVEHARASIALTGNIPDKVKTYRSMIDQGSVSRIVFEIV